MNYLYGTEELGSDIKRTQTYQATHKGDGSRLPFMYRSFISFSYGGKQIEDFYLIATQDGTLDKQIYSSFEDSTSDYKTIDGQYYWGTRMEPNELDFTLSTDWMDQKTLEAFKHWFRPGVERELILAEHPNRYIWARVKEPPEIEMVPFGEEVTMQFQNEYDEVKEVTTMTTVYKGSISLSFVMDEPYWIGILNYIPYPGRINTNETEERVANLLNQLIEVNSLTSKDLLKICLEDQLPHDFARNSSGEQVLIGLEKAYEQILISQVAGINDESTYSTPPYARLGQSYITYAPRIAVTDISSLQDEGPIIGYELGNSDNISVGPNQTQYLFYSGTAPSKPILKFSMELKFDTTTGYITHPSNTIADNNNIKSYVKVGDHTFEFTTPGICTMYNKTLQIMHTADDTETVFDFRKKIRDKIKNKYARKWAIYCLSEYEDNEPIVNIRHDFITDFMELFTQQIREEAQWQDDEPVSKEAIYYYVASFTFNSKTGEATGVFQINTIENNEVVEKSIIENVGDMALTNYLIIDERNYLNEYGLIIAGGENNNCTEITSNEDLFNFMILYNNMYY